MQRIELVTAPRVRRRIFLSLLVGAAAGGSGLLAACQAPAAPPAAAAATPTSAAAVAPTTVASKPAPSRPAGLAELAKYTGPDRQQILEEGAKREGTVSWYTSLSSPVLDLIPQAFEKKYPGVKVEKFRGTPGDVAQRILEEAQSRRNLFDVTELGDNGLIVVQGRGLLQPFTSPLLADFPAESRWAANGTSAFAVMTRMSIAGFGYNASTLPKTAVPATYDDLLRPELKGRMAWPGSDTATRVIGNLLLHKGESFVRQLGGQQIATYAGSATVVRDMIGSGEVASSPAAFANQMQDLKKKGAPAEWVPLEPATPSPGGPAISLSAPHPHAALLFTDFQLGPEVRGILRDNGYATPADKLPFSIWYPIEGTTKYEEFDQRFQDWVKLQHEVFGA